MTDRNGRKPDGAEKLVRDIRRATRRQYSPEEKIRIVLEGLRGEVSIAELCRKEGIARSMYYGWSKESRADDPLIEAENLSEQAGPPHCACVRAISVTYRESTTVLGM